MAKNRLIREVLCFMTISLTVQASSSLREEDLDVLLAQNHQKIELSGKDIGKNQTPFLLDKLAQNQEVKDLDLSHNHIHAEAATDIGGLLCENTALTRVNLSHNQLNDADLEDIVDGFLVGKSPLLTLMLEDNFITEAGKKIIQEQCKNYNVSLSFTVGDKDDMNASDKRRLSILWGQQKMTHSEEIPEKENKILQNINLDDLRETVYQYIMSQYGRPEKKQSLTHHDKKPSLTQEDLEKKLASPSQEITLSNLGLNKKYTPFILEKLAQSEDVKALNLSHNHIHAEAATDIGGLLCENKSLTYLDLSHNQLSDGDLEDIADGITCNPESKLQKLILYGNPFTQTGKKRVDEVLYAHNPPIEVVWQKPTLAAEEMDQLRENIYTKPSLEKGVQYFENLYVHSCQNRQDNTGDRVSKDLENEQEHANLFTFLTKQLPAKLKKKSLSPDQASQYLKIYNYYWDARQLPKEHEGIIKKLEKVVGSQDDQIIHNKRGSQSFK